MSMLLNSIASVDPTALNVRHQLWQLLWC